MGRLLTEPWVIATIIAVAVLLFAAPKLPLMARNLGQSMRIFKKEVREFKEDGEALASSAHSVISEEDSPATTSSPALSSGDR